MFPIGFKELVVQVIQSWEVIAVTVVLVLFMYLVGYVSRHHHRPLVSKSKPKKQKAAAKPVKKEVPEGEFIEEEDGNS